MTQTDDKTLVAYLDGELDAASAEDVEAALERDPALRQELARLQRTGASVRAAYGWIAHEPIPRRLIEAVRRPSPRPFGRPRRALAIAASVAVLLVGFGGGYLAATAQRRSQAPVESVRLLDEILAYHAFYSQWAKHLVEIPAARGAELEAWLSQSLHRRLRIPDLSSRGLTFQGGRLYVVNGQPVAELIYTSPSLKPLGVCITFGQAGADTPPTLRKARRLSLLSWQREGYIYGIVGWATEPFLRSLHKDVARMLEQTRWEEGAAPVSGGRGDGAGDS